MTAKIPRSVRESQLNALPGKRFVRWVDGEYRNAYSKAVMQCEHGHEWSSSVDSMINQNTGCPACSGKYRYSPEERIEQLNALPGFRFVMWHDCYKNRKSRAVMACENMHEWTASVNNLLYGIKGCPHCAGNAARSAEESEKALNALPGRRFVRWKEGYKNAHSKATMECSLGHRWSASIDSMLNAGRSCPTCAKPGFNPDYPATLYALRSECGQHVKIGITGNLDQRMTQLKRSTPFEFAVIGTVEGRGHDIRDLENMFHGEFQSSELTSFDGATEWLTFNPQILSLLRLLGA